MSTKTIILSPSHSVNTGDDIRISDWTKLALEHGFIGVSPNVDQGLDGCPACRLRIADPMRGPHVSWAIALFRSVQHGTSFHVSYM